MSKEIQKDPPLFTFVYVLILRVVKYFMVLTLKKYYLSIRNEKSAIMRPSDWVL